ncbi:MAG: 50S ribosomal protein L32 [Firmicutes bacterium]|nr:50S ribosomal protein L32 [Bacillota bacterium]
MGNPKQKFGKSRTRKRRANWKTSAPVLAACPRCKKPRLPHTVCDECGYYDGGKSSGLRNRERSQIEC